MSDPNQKKIAILYSDAKREYFPTEEQFITEEEVFKRAKIVAPYFQKIGYEVELIPGNQDLVDNLKSKGPFAFCLNLVDSIRGKEYLCPVIPATLELMNIPYVGTGMLGLAINSNKFLTKTLMEQAGLPLPRYQLFQTPNDPLDTHLKFPLISKLNEIHGSVEITREAVSENEAHLRARLKSLMSVYHQPVVVEEFIAGRELTVFLLEGVFKKVYVAEKAFKPSEEKYKMATFDAVWGSGEGGYDVIKAEGHGLLEQYTRTAFEVLKMDDYAKFDVRLDESGRYYFIDCNANPAFGPLESDCAVSHVLNLYGVDFEQIIRRLAQNVTRSNTDSLITTTTNT